MDYSRLRRALSVIFLLAIAVFWLNFLISNSDEFSVVLSGIDTGIFLLSFILILVGYFPFVYNWRYFMGIFGEKTSLAFSAESWLVPNLAKYIPGAIWIPLARGFHNKERGITLSKTYASWFLEIYLTITASVLISMLYILLIQEVRFASIPILILIIFLIISFFFRDYGMEIFYRIVTRLNKGKRIGNLDSLIKGIRKRDLIKPLAVYMLFYLIYGLWLMALSMSVNPLSTDILFFMFVWVFSWVIGYVIIIVPGGIGVREGVMAFLLTTAGYPLGVAVAIAFLARIQVFALDSALGGSLVMFRRFVRTRAS